MRFVFFQCISVSLRHYITVALFLTTKPNQIKKNKAHHKLSETTSNEGEKVSLLIILKGWFPLSHDLIVRPSHFPSCLYFVHGVPPLVSLFDSLDERFSTDFHSDGEQKKPTKVRIRKCAGRHGHVEPGVNTGAVNKSGQSQERQRKPSRNFRDGSIWRKLYRWRRRRTVCSYTEQVVCFI